MSDCYKIHTIMSAPSVLAPASQGDGGAGGDDDFGVVIDPHSKKKGEETWTGLDLANQGLYNVSDSIGYYTHLTSLFLSNNNLVSLPKTLFSNLINLTHIDLSYNRLTHIPPEIEELQQLKRLLLYQNRITELPLEMGRLWRYAHAPTHAYAFAGVMPSMLVVSTRIIAMSRSCSLPLILVTSTTRSRLSVLNLDGNPITSPPPAVLQQGTDQIIAYLRDRVRRALRALSLSLSLSRAAITMILMYPPDSIRLWGRSIFSSTRTRVALIR